MSIYEITALIDADSLDDFNCIVDGLVDQGIEVTSELEITTQANAVSHPSHYTSGGIECKDAMAAMMGTSYCLQPCANWDEAKNLAPIAFYWWGNAFKYLWRWIRKNGIQDLEKCKQCIDFLIEESTTETTAKTSGLGGE